MNCSALMAAIAQGRPSIRVLVYTGALALCAASAQGQEMEEIEDAAARIQYAYYTGDARELQSALGEMEGLEADPKLKGVKAYHLAYGQWRLAELHAQAGALGSSPTGRSLASRAAQACAKHAQEAVAADARHADAYAIQAICPAFAATAAAALRNERRERPSCRMSALRTATALEPDNPRVLFVSRLCMQEPPTSDELRKVVAAFESAPPRASRAPDWGHAEALALLGQRYLTSGDAVAARDALERALVIAPDYREAQELLQTAAVRPR
jgi:tetratricopeptide (TPR) repeat protein